MTRSLIAVGVLGAIVAVLSCDGPPTAPRGGTTNDECPVGSFKPPGWDACVIPATDQFGNDIGVPDNRCAVGQPGFPPRCVSDSGGRAYLTVETTCAPGYRYQPGSCLRSGPPPGTGGGFMTGSDGTGFNTGFGTGQAGVGGPAGVGAADGTGFMTGSDGTGFGGCAGTTGCDGTGFSTAGTSGAAGANE